MKGNASERNEDESNRPTFVSLARVIATSISLLTRREKTLLGLRIVFRLALNFLDIVAVAMMGLLGGLTATGLTGQQLSVFGFELPRVSASILIGMVSIVAALFFLKGAFSILLARWTAVFLAEVEIRNSARVARFLFQGNLSRVKSYSRAKLQFLVENSVAATFSGVLGSAVTLVVESSLFLGIVVLFFLLDPIAASLILVYFAILIGVLQASTASRFVRSGRFQRESLADSRGALFELIDAFREIAVLSKQAFFIGRFVDAKKVSARTALTLQILKQVPRFIAETGLIFGALGFLVWQLSSGSIGDGLVALGVFLAGSFRIMGALLPLQGVWNQLRVSEGWVSEAQHILTQVKFEPDEFPLSLFSLESAPAVLGSARRDVPGIRVEVSNLTFSHRNQSEWSIRDVSVEIEAGTKVAIIGPSGAGKTSLIDLMLGLYEPDSGTVLLDSLSPREMRATHPGEVAYVPQRPGLVAGSVAENVALGVPRDLIDDQAVWLSLAAAQLDDFVRGLPGGIDSGIGQQNDALSGGQVQRIGLARALYVRPRLLVLDEATSALDAETEAGIGETLRRFGAETTVVVIAHRLSTIQYSDNVFYMEDGELVASGTFSKLRKSVPRVERYVRLMSFDDD